MQARLLRVTLHWFGLAGDYNPEDYDRRMKPLHPGTMPRAGGCIGKANQMLDRIEEDPPQGAVIVGSLNDFCITHGRIIKSNGETRLDSDQFDESARGSDAKRLKIFKESTPEEPVVNVLWTTTGGYGQGHPHLAKSN